MSGQVEKATILRTLPEPLKSHLLVNSQRFTNGAEVRTAVRDYLMARREWRPPAAMTRERDTSGPMDVDEVTWRWKGGNSKGKGKDKGKHSKGKGKGKDKDKDGKGKGSSVNWGCRVCAASPRFTSKVLSCFSSMWMTRLWQEQTRTSSGFFVSSNSE